jgi:ACT domain-containing protein
MKIQKAIGRPPKVTYTTMLRLEDSIQHNSTIAEACNWVGISRTTFFYYMRNNKVFRDRMTAAKQRQDEVVFSFFTFT